MPLHERLRELRRERGFGTQKQFCSHARRQGFEITSRRYGAIERGEVKPSSDDIILICSALRISADTWLFGGYSGVDMRGLTDAERLIVSDLAKALVRLRDKA